MDDQKEDNKPLLLKYSNEIWGREIIFDIYLQLKLVGLNILKIITE